MPQAQGVADHRGGTEAHGQRRQHGRQQRAAEPQATQAQAAIGADNAVMVGIDAKTGKLRPLTATEAKALAAKAAAMPRQARSSSIKAPRTPEEARATIRRHANGTMSMRAPLT